MHQVTIINLSPEPFPIDTISLAGTISPRLCIYQITSQNHFPSALYQITNKYLGIITIVGKDLGIITLAGKDLGIITLADKGLDIKSITCLIMVFNNQCTQAISHHMEETPIQVHFHAIKHFINQSIKVDN
ncbi:hypothetical protein H5410_014193 [Solanum commersonii]|uniref:Uncharacterized protein n=1 Tax=Solanum commersonii TaxID=4109 RepID=A0A9J5ZQ91_SOLCO|nr:hypothetical protein H5410_014193 [Solanum commersonii]